MSRKKIIIISIIILVVAGLAIALLLIDQSFFSPQSATLDNNQNANTVLPLGDKTAAPAAPAVKLSSAEQSINNLARNFAERFGSFSTDNAGVNLEEVKSLATEQFKKFLDQEIAKIKSQSGLSFYGVSSRALKVKIDNLDEAATQAEVLVSLQREESKTGQNNFVFNQDLKLTLIKAGEVWLIDQAQWR